MLTTPPSAFSTFNSHEFSSVINLQIDSHSVWEHQLWELLQTSLSQWVQQNLLKAKTLPESGKVNTATSALKDVIPGSLNLSPMYPLLNVSHNMIEALIIHPSDDSLTRETKQIFIRILAEERCSSLVPAVSVEEFLEVFEQKASGNEYRTLSKLSWPNFFFLDYYWSRVRDFARVSIIECASIFQLPEEVVIRLANSVAPQVTQYCYRTVDHALFSLACPEDICLRIWKTLNDSKLSHSEKQNLLATLRILKTEQCIQRRLQGVFARTHAD